MTSSQTRIMLWAVPRSLSSAMCRVMLNSGLSTQILFELYGMPYYFGPERISDRYADHEPDPQYSYENTKLKLELPYPGKELVFAKDMSYYLWPERNTADWIPDGYTHTFITRHPQKTVKSFLKVIDKNVAGWTMFDARESGHKEQAEMMRLLKNLGHRVIVIDADDLMDDPEATLQTYCREVGLKYRDSMIHWEPMSSEDFQSIFCDVFEEEWFSDLKAASSLNRKPKPRADDGHSHLDVFASYDQATRKLAWNTVEENIKHYEDMMTMSADQGNNNRNPQKGKSDQEQQPAEGAQQNGPHAERLPLKRQRSTGGDSPITEKRSRRPDLGEEEEES